MHFMASILILYVTTQGHTVRIAGRMASRLRLIVGHDTTRDYEYTDWDAVARFADVFAHRLERP